MAFHLYSASTLSELVQHLGNFLEETASKLQPDPLQTWPLLVPSHLVEEWLRHDLVNRFQGGLDAQFLPLSEGLWTIWKRYCCPEDKTFSQLSPGHLRDLILSVFLEPPIGCPASLEPVWRYIFRQATPGIPEIPGASGISDTSATPGISDISDISNVPGNPSIPNNPTISNVPGNPSIPNIPSIRNIPDPESEQDWFQRAWQLAGIVAESFLAYESHESFPPSANQASHPHASHPHFAWQRDLFHLIFAPDGRQSIGFPDRLSLRQLVCSIPTAPADIDCPIFPITVFGFDHLSPLAIDMLHRLAGTTTVALFLLNAGESISGLIHDRSTDGNNSGMPLWRVPIRATAERINQLLDPAPHFLQTSPSTTRRNKSRANLLVETQDRLLSRSTSDGKTFSQDRSLQVWACPGPHREAETVVQLLAGLMDAGKGLVNEVAILMTRPEVYQPLFIEALQRAGIPFAVSGNPASLPGHFAQGMDALFALAEQGFTRAAVFRLLTNPCWQKTRQADPGMVHDWLIWADELCIFAGFTTLDKCRSCDLPGRLRCDVCLNEDGQGKGISLTSAHTWQLALRRLRLGRIMETREYSPGDPVMPLFGDCAPFQDFAANEADTLAAFSIGVEILHAMTDALGRPGQIRLCGEWAETLRQVIDTCMAARPEHPEDLAERSGALSMVDRLGTLESLFPRGLPFEIVRSYILAGCSVFMGSGERTFMGGLTLAPLTGGAVLPWRQTFVVGLGENHFPGGSFRSSIDLFNPPPGEESVSGHRSVAADELNRQAFLQVILATQEKLILTFSNLDPAREAELNPSSVLLQLEEFLARHVLPAGTLFRRAIVPTAPLSAGYLLAPDEPWRDPLRQATRTDWLAAWLLARQENSPVLTETPEIAGFLEEARRKRVALLPKGRETPPMQLKIRIGIYSISEFLQDPATATLRRWIRSDGDNPEDDWEKIEAAPIVANDRLARKLIKRSIHALFGAEETAKMAKTATSEELASFFQKGYDWEHARSRLPDGFWGKIDRAGLTDRFVKMVNRVRQLFDIPSLDGKELETITLGSFFSSEKGAHLPPLRMRIPAPSLPTTVSNAPCSDRDPAIGETLESSADDSRLHPLPPEWDLEICGRLPMVWSDRGEEDKELHALVFRDTSKSLKPLDGFLLEPLLTYLGLMLWNHDEESAGRPPLDMVGKLIRLHVISPDGADEIAYAPSLEFAHEYLPTLIGEYLAQRKFEDLRLRVVNLVPFPPPDDQDPAAYIEALRSALDSSKPNRGAPQFFSDLFKTIGEPSIPEDALAKVRKRLIPLWKTRFPSARTAGKAKKPHA